MNTHESFWNAIEQKICSGCIDAGEDGVCRLSSREECAVKRFLPEIVRVVESVDDRSVDPYVTKLRESVCGSCSHQSPSGTCTVRDDLDCALDRYFPLIVQVIEEEKQRQQRSR